MSESRSNQHLPVHRIFSLNRTLACEKKMDPYRLDVMYTDPQGQIRYSEENFNVGGYSVTRNQEIVIRNPSAGGSGQRSVDEYSYRPSIESGNRSSQSSRPSNSSKSSRSYNGNGSRSSHSSQSSHPSYQSHSSYSSSPSFESYDGGSPYSSYSSHSSRFSHPSNASYSSRPCIEYGSRSSHSSQSSHPSRSSRSNYNSSRRY